MKKLLSHQLVKFAIVGVFNTLIDVVLFTVLRLSGLDLLVANTISTSVALAFSLIVNNNYTFKERKLTLHRTILYIGVTLAGLWVLQPIIIKLITTLHQYVNYTAPFTSIFGHEDVWQTLLPKILSVVVTVAWNYLWYNYVVFPKEDKKVAAIA